MPLKKPNPAKVYIFKIHSNSSIDGQNEEFKGNNGLTNPPQTVGLTNPFDTNLLAKGMFDPLMMNGGGKGGFFDALPFDDPSFMDQSNLYNKMKERNRYERSMKIERYKNKKRNWQKKIAYDCRKKVADTRLRIKGRFISKKVLFCCFLLHNTLINII